MPTRYTNETAVLLPDRPHGPIPEDAYCDHYLDRDGVRFYCGRDKNHPHGHSAPDHQIDARGIYVQWLTGDPGDGVR